MSLSSRQIFFCFSFSQSLISARYRSPLKARKMSAVHDTRAGIRQKPLHRGEIIVGVGVVGVFDQRPVIEDIAGKKRLGLRFPERDPAGRMAGRVDNLEAFDRQDRSRSPSSKNTRRRRILHPVAFRAIGLRRQRVENLVGDVRIGKRVDARVGCASRSASAAMDRAAFEFVVAADMVEMRVAGDGNQFALGDQRHPLAQRHDAHAAIDQHVSVAAPHMPDIAAVELLDKGFGDVGDIVQAPGLLRLFVRRLIRSVGSRFLPLVRRQGRDIAGRLTASPTRVASGRARRLRHVRDQLQVSARPRRQMAAIVRAKEGAA